jgi:hypothetical protein
MKAVTSTAVGLVLISAFVTLLLPLSQPREYRVIWGVASHFLHENGTCINIFGREVMVHVGPQMRLKARPMASAIRSGRAGLWVALRFLTA